MGQSILYKGLAVQIILFFYVIVLHSINIFNSGSIKEEAVCILGHKKHMGPRATWILSDLYW